MSHPEAAPNPSVEQALIMQRDWAEPLGSPFYRLVLGALLENYQAGGVVYRLLAHWPGDAKADALPLRLTGFLNHLVRRGAVPELSPLWPDPNADQCELGGVMADVLRLFEDEARDFLTHHVQTNEVGRSAILLPGMIEVARAVGLPLSLMEIGASAGLNLIWDRYGYDLGGTAWGDAASPVHLTLDWQGPKPALDLVPEVASRAACDVSPLDIDDPAQVERAIAYIWPDQTDRIARFEAAVALAREAGVSVARASADDWLEAQLATPAPGTARVLYHSIMWQYLPQTVKDRITALMNEAGAAATPGAPLAWMAFEPFREDMVPELRLTLWDGNPGGPSVRRLAWCHPHGRTLEWLGEAL